ncbi:MAG TPA: EAL domain-containing protein [Rhodocyclaceae bacterium]|nr:EAL domain-containing protein [Rhodocyclaceae bacterium]
MSTQVQIQMATQAGASANARVTHQSNSVVQNVEESNVEESFPFSEEILPTDTDEPPKHRWRILIADDDEEVHSATAFALRAVKIDGSALELLHAHSAQEAQSILQTQADIAVIMLDVVMETPHAGLSLVKTIRQDLELRSMRIILRTGQPGYAPELEVIRNFDINDYRTKSELTHTRLITTLTAAIRAYSQLEQIEANNRGLSEVVRSSNNLFRLRSAREFARSALESLGKLLCVVPQGLVCVEQRNHQEIVDTDLHVLHGVGRFGVMVGSILEKAADVEIQRAVRRCVASKTIVFDGNAFTMWLGHGSHDVVIYFDVERPLQDIERRLLEVFATNLAVGFENVDLFERLDFFAFFDPLTRLPNRSRFLADVDQDLFSRQGGSRCLAIADIVRFSDINDALGHRCGDTLLIGVSKRLRAATGTGVSMARISGDSFGIFGPENAIDLAAIRRAFEAPFFVHGHALAVQVRLGVVRVADSKGSAVELLRNANLALNQARQSGGGASNFFTRSLSEDVQNRVALLHSLRAAIDFRRGLAVHYQPQVDARTGRLIGVEALLRWRNDYGEMISPDRFIPLAERTGMINELGLWAMEVALDRLATWHGQGHRDLRMSINISPVQFRAEDFVDKVRHIVKLCDASLRHITFEITESVGLEDHDLLASHLTALHAMGIKFAIDDFGTGFSSLSQLTRLPADILKIDRAFVSTITDGPGDRAVAATVVMLAQSRQLGVVAEGVETAEQMQILLELGCDQMQGYYFGHPMSPDQFDAWLLERPKGSGELPIS